MNLFDRITDQLLVECEDGEVNWHQAWCDAIPEGTKEPKRSEEEQECYSLAWDVICKFLERDGALRLNCDEVSTKAFYAKDDDQITAPCRLQFECDADFFCTLFHELVHSTGAPNRLKRKGIGAHTQGDYNEEELIAEMGSMFLCGICCYNDGKVFEQSSAYVRSYKQATNTSNEQLKILARQALRAVDYILGENEE